MKRVLLVAPISDEAAVIELLQDLGVLEIVRVDAGEAEGVPSRGAGAQDSDTLDAWLAEFKYCVDFFDRFEKVKRNLIQQFSGGKVPLAEQRFREYGALVEDGRRIYKQCRELDDELARINREEARLTETVRQLEPWQWLDVPLSEASGGRAHALVLCEIPAGSVDGLGQELEATGEGVHIVTGPPTRRAVPAALVCLAKDKQKVIETLGRHGVEQSHLPAAADTPRAETDRAREELSKLAREREDAMSKVRSLLAERLKVLSLYDSVSSARERRIVASRCPATRSAFAVEGWIREDDLPELERAVASRFELVHMESRDPEEGETPPVALDNPPLITPFEAVTEIYSLPQVGAIDPTAALAPFFFVFFGMALGDVGYGLALTALSTLLLRKVKMEGLAKKLFRLLAMCGLSSAAVGVLTGSWFGNLFRIPPIWFDPLQNPMLMLGLSLGLGVVHIYVGLGIKLYSNVKRGRLADGLFDQGFWLAFLTGLLLLLAGSALGRAGILVTGKWLALGGAAGLVLTQGRAHANPIKRIGSGILSLYSVTGYLSDVLSYSRLLALGLASAVIAVVIDDMAVRMLGIPFVGWLPMLVLLVIGHTFNLGINVVGSYVHSSRLQYVEFFSKFFEGGGRRFLPFRRKTRYIEVV